MWRAARLAEDLVQRLGLEPDTFDVHYSSARAAPVADVHRGYFRGHRYTDIGGFGLYEIVDDGRVSFENRKMDRLS